MAPKANQSKGEKKATSNVKLYPEIYEMIKKIADQREMTQQGVMKFLVEYFMNLPPEEQLRAIAPDLVAKAKDSLPTAQIPRRSHG